MCMFGTEVRGQKQHTRGMFCKAAGPQGLQTSKEAPLRCIYVALKAMVQSVQSGVKGLQRTGADTHHSKTKG